MLLFHMVSVLIDRYVNFNLFLLVEIDVSSSWEFR